MGLKDITKSLLIDNSKVFDKRVYVEVIDVTICPIKKIAKFTIVHSNVYIINSRREPRLTPTLLFIKEIFG